MTTPAQSVEVLNRIDSAGMTREIRSGVPGPWQPWASTNAIGSLERNLRPQSVNSPVRADGTRAPKAWDRRWGYAVSPKRSVEWIRSNATSLTEVRANVLLVDLGNGFDSILSQAGGGWARRTSPHSFPYDAESIARTKLLNNLLQKQADWGVTLGEMRDTVRGIRRVSSDIIDLIDYLARTTRRTKRAVVETILGIPARKRRKTRSRTRRERLDRADRLITDQWLQYQFSVAPTLADIHQSSEALSWLLFEEKRPMRMKFRAGAKVSSRESVTLRSRVSPGWSGTLPVETTAECHMSCYYDIEPTTEATFQQLGLTNPASVAWELLAFSWMVDYVTTIGDWISSMTRNDLSTFVEGSMTRVVRVADRGPMTFKFDSRIIGHSGFGSPRLTLDAGRMQRSVLQNVYPAIRPAFRNRMGITQMANVLAVLRNLAR